MTAAAALALLLQIAQPPVEPPGKAIFAASCAMCHVESSPSPVRQPLLPALRQMPPHRIRDALTIGVMEEWGMLLAPEDIEDLIAWLTKPEAKPAPPPAAK